MMTDSERCTAVTLDATLSQRRVGRLVDGAKQTQACASDSSIGRVDDLASLAGSNEFNDGRLHEARSGDNTLAE